MWWKYVKRLRVSWCWKASLTGTYPAKAHISIMNFHLLSQKMASRMRWSVHFQCTPFSWRLIKFCPTALCFRATIKPGTKSQLINSTWQNIKTKHRKWGGLCLVDYFFVVTMLRGNKSRIVGKPDCFPFKWSHICQGPEFMGTAAELSMWVTPIKDLPNLLF